MDDDGDGDDDDGDSDDDDDDEDPYEEVEEEVIFALLKLFLVVFFLMTACFIFNVC